MLFCYKSDPHAAPSVLIPLAMSYPTMDCSWQSLRVRHSPDEQRRRLYKRLRIRLTEVAESDFMSEEQARCALGLRTRRGVRSLATPRILRPAITCDGTVGITRRSVEEDLEWRRTASRVKRLRRRVRGLLRFF